MKRLKDMGSVAAFDGKHKIYCLTVIGEIEGHSVLPEQNKTTKYEHVIPQLVAIEESREIEGLLVVLNTVGGDVEAGLAIAELISGMKKPTVSYVLGRRALDRRAACGFGKALVYCALGHHDGAPRADNGSCYRRAAGHESLCTNAGENNRFRGRVILQLRQSGLPSL